MAASPRIPAPLSRLTRVLAIGLAAASLLAVVVPVAHADSDANITGTSTADVCNSGTRGSGQMDAAGRLYLACDRAPGGLFGSTYYTAIQIRNANGAIVQYVPLPWQASDVAPSPDGAYLYIGRYNDRTIVRYDRAGDGSYALNAAWKLENLPNGELVRGEYMATDAAGYLYVSSGIWDNNADRTDRWNTARRNVPVANTIVKYTAGGAYLTHFGSIAAAPQDDSAWDAGVAFDEWAGIAVTATGDRVFVADKLNSRVHRFDRVGATYQARIAFGNTKELAGRDARGNFVRDGSCYQPGRLAAPYDLALSPGGEVLVINTSCLYDGRLPAWDVQPAGGIEVQRFGQDGSSRGVIMGRTSDAYRARVHGIAVDRRGVIHLPQGGITLTPKAGYSDFGADFGGGGPLGGTAPAGNAIHPPIVVPGAPDTAAPIITSVTATQVGYTKTVRLSIVATDDRGIVDVRTAEDKKPFAWRGAYAPTIEHTFDDFGTIWVAVMVADAAGNTSDYVWTQAKLVPPPAVVVPPVVVPTPAPSVPAPATPAPVVTPQPTTPGVSPNKLKPGNANTTTPGAANAAAGGAVTGGGAGPAIGAAKADPLVANASSPSITAVKLPPSTTTGRLTARIAAKDPEGGRLYVRVAGENGRWSKLRPIGAVPITLSKGAGWKGVFVQVVDAQGNRSRVWFQSVLSAPRTAKWVRGSKTADKLRGSRKAEHFDLSRYDGRVDRVSCGAGYDTVLLQPGDIAAKDCEKVVYLRTPAS